MKKTVIALLSSAVALVGIALLWQPYLTPLERTDSVNFRRLDQYVELMPERSGEYSRLHLRRPDGTEAEIRIRYRDGSNGVLTLSTDGQLDREISHYPDGALRKEARYGGEVRRMLFGREFRPDKTPVLEVDSSSDGSVTTTVVYWRDGRTVFLRQVDDRANFRRTRQYFYQTGRIMASIEKAMGGHIFNQKAWHETGAIAFERSQIKLSKADFVAIDGPPIHSHLADATEIRHYSEAGKLSSRIVWRQEPDIYSDGDMGGPGDRQQDRFNPKFAEYYQEDGETVVRRLVAWDLGGAMVGRVEYPLTGSTVERRYVDIAGKVTSMDIYDIRLGKVIYHDASPKMNAEVLQKGPFDLPLDPGPSAQKSWKQAELIAGDKSSK